LVSSLKIINDIQRIFLLIIFTYTNCGITFFDDGFCNNYFCRNNDRVGISLYGIHYVW